MLGVLRPKAPPPAIRKTSMRRIKRLLRKLLYLMDGHKRQFLSIRFWKGREKHVDSYIDLPPAKSRPSVCKLIKHPHFRTILPITRKRAYLKRKVAVGSIAALRHNVDLGSQSNWRKYSKQRPQWARRGLKFLIRR